MSAAIYLIQRDSLIITLAELVLQVHHSDFRNQNVSGKGPTSQQSIKEFDRR